MKPLVEISDEAEFEARFNQALTDDKDARIMFESLLLSLAEGTDKRWSNKRMHRKFFERFVAQKAEFLRKTYDLNDLQYIRSLVKTKKAIEALEFEMFKRMVFNEQQ